MTDKLSTRDLSAIIENANIEDYREAYSGRAMYGETCLAIVGGPGELVRFTQAVGDYINDEIERQVAREGGAGGPELRALKHLFHNLSHVKSDEMGLRTVYYWPGVQVEGFERNSR